MSEEAGIDRKEVYVTNAVKHFKWEPRGKKRIHPSSILRAPDSQTRRLETRRFVQDLVRIVRALEEQSSPR